MKDVSRHLVDFKKWCPSCKNYTKSEDEEPCAICLCNPITDGTDKPLDWSSAKGE